MLHKKKGFLLNIYLNGGKTEESRHMLYSCNGNAFKTDEQKDLYSQQVVSIWSLPPQEIVKTSSFRDNPENRADKRMLQGSNVSPDIAKPTAKDAEGGAKAVKGECHNKMVHSPCLAWPVNTTRHTVPGKLELYFAPVRYFLCFKCSETQFWSLLETWLFCYLLQVYNMPILWIERPERSPANTELLRDFFFFLIVMLFSTKFMPNSIYNVSFFF